MHSVDAAHGHGNLSHEEVRTANRILDEHRLERSGLSQVRIMHGVLDMAGKTAADVMIPIERVFMLDIERRLDHALLQARHLFLSRWLTVGNRWQGCAPGCWQLRHIRRPRLPGMRLAVSISESA